VRKKDDKNCGKFAIGVVLLHFFNCRSRYGPTSRIYVATCFCLIALKYLQVWLCSWSGPINVLRSLHTHKTPWPESESELYRPSDRLLFPKLVSSFADRWSRVVSATDPYGRILGVLDWSRCYFSQVAPLLYSRGWVDPVPDPLLLRKSRSAGNRTRNSDSVVRNPDY
jgi:hypothetical protein